MFGFVLQSRQQSADVISYRHGNQKPLYCHKGRILGVHVPLTWVFAPQQAYNAAVAINHMKKLQLAHSEQVMRQVSIPGIKVVDMSSPVKHRKQRDPEEAHPKAGETHGNTQLNHMSLPASPTELKSHYHPLKATQSQAVAHHSPSMAMQGTHVYHSEPANLNGFVAAERRTL